MNGLSLVTCPGLTLWGQQDLAGDSAFSELWALTQEPPPIPPTHTHVFKWVQYFFSIVPFRIGSFLSILVGQGRKMLVKGCDQWRRKSGRFVDSISLGFAGRWGADLKMKKEVLTTLENSWQWEGTERVGRGLGSGEVLRKKIHFIILLHIIKSLFSVLKLTGEM